MNWYIAKPVSDPALRKRLQWVADMLTASADVAEKIGVGPEVIVAQAAQESGWGASTQGRFGLFGVKAGPNWTGLKVLCPTREWDEATQSYTYISDWFRDFASFKECIEEHFTFLNQKRWRDAGVFDRLGDEHFFEALKRGGYATDPNYVDNLMRVENTISDYYLPYLVAADRPPPAPLKRPVIHIGDSGPDVLALQTALARGDFYHGKLDGDFGRRTYDALVAFQIARKLTVDGVAGDETWGVITKEA